MEYILILIMGYYAGRSDHYHKQARLFRDGFVRGWKDAL